MHVLYWMILFLCVFATKFVVTTECYACYGTPDHPWKSKEGFWLWGEYVANLRKGTYTFCDLAIERTHINKRCARPYCLKVNTYDGQILRFCGELNSCEKWKMWSELDQVDRAVDCRVCTGDLCNNAYFPHPNLYLPVLLPCVATYLHLS